MRVAYFTNTYPAVSHTFIRREICGIETLGVTVSRYALRPAEIFDPEDIREKNELGIFSEPVPASYFAVVWSCYGPNRFR